MPERSSRDLYQVAKGKQQHNQEKQNERNAPVSQSQSWKFHKHCRLTACKGTPARLMTRRADFSRRFKQKEAFLCR